MKRREMIEKVIGLKGYLSKDKCTNEISNLLDNVVILLKDDEIQIQKLNNIYDYLTERR